MTPAITVIMPHYRCERFLAEAVRSILQQTHQDLRLVVVDDHSSTDEWQRSLTSFEADTRLAAFTTSARVGPYRIANRILAETQSTYVGYQDADDVSHPTRLERQMALIRDTSADIAGCRFTYIDQDSRPLTSLRWEHALLRHDIRRDKLAHHPASLVRRHVYDTIGGYDGRTTFGADTEFMLRAGYLFRIRNCQAPLYSVRLRSDSLTHGPTTGQHSPARRWYKGELATRTREWDRAACSDSLVARLQGQPNDVEFHLTQVL